MPDLDTTYTIKVNTQLAIRQVKNLKANIRKVGSAALVAGKSIDKNLAKDAGRGLEKVSQKSEKAARSVKKIGINAQKASAALQGFSRAFRRYVALPIAGAGVLSIKFARDFNKGMANVATLIPGQAKRIDELKNSILGLSVETGKSLEDLTGGLYETISAFGDTEDTMLNLGVASKASVAGLASTKESLALLSAVTKGYGDTSFHAMEKASDLAFMTVKLGQTTFPELATSMGRVIPLAATLNTTQEELFATMATLTGVTGNAAEVSTQLASVYSAFLKPSEKMTEFAKRYGYESGAAMMKAEGLAKTIKVLGEYTKGDEAALAKLLKRKEALVAVLALAGGQADTYNQKQQAMADYAGATTKAFKEQTEGINATGHSFEQTKRRMIALAVRGGDRLLPVVNRLLDRIDPLIKYFEDMDEKALDFYITMGKWLILFGAGSKLMTGLSTFNNIFGVQMMGAMTTAPGKIGATTKALGGLAKGVNILAAALAGYAAGTAISEMWLEPHAQKRADITQRMEDADISAERIAKTGTLQEQRAALAKLQSEKRVLKEGPKSLEEHVGIMIDPTGYGERMGRAEARAEAGISTLQQAIRSKEEYQELLLEGGSLTRGGGGAKVTQSIDASIHNMTIHAADPADAERRVRRVIQEQGRELEAALKQAAKEEVATEQ